jgi:hypothetical protein
VIGGLLGGDFHAKVITYLSLKVPFPVGTPNIKDITLKVKRGFIWHFLSQNLLQN